MPSFCGADFDAALTDAVTPDRADVMTARSVALDLLAEGGTPTEIEVRHEWMRRHGIDPNGPTTLTATRVGDRFDPPTRDDAAIVRIRGEAAVAEAIARLIADGLLVPIHTNGSVPAVYRGVPVEYPGGTQSAEYRLNFPVLGVDDPQARWRLLDGDTPVDREVLSADDLCEGLEPLLGLRGLRALTEAHAALRRRLWLAAAGMLATASEAAWFSLARNIARPGSQLERLAIAGEDSAKVHQLATQRLQETGVQKSLIHDLGVQGAYFRDIRNYALHPGGPHDSDREVSMTEAGCIAVFMSARRYFVKMLGVYERPGSASPLQSATSS
jgi:hypothetical protein